MAGDGMISAELRLNTTAEGGKHWSNGAGEPLKIFIRFYNVMIVILLLSLVGLSGCQTTASPTWAQSPYFLAGSSSLVTTLTNSPFTNSYNIPFSPATATDPPYLAIGIKSYTGSDYLLQEYFNISVLSCTSAGMNVQLDLSGITTPTLLAISYILVEQTYPLSINLFYGIDLNYSTPLANISTMSEQLQSHTEVVDFTGSQSLWSFSTYNSFAAPLSNHRILFFMSTLYIVSTSTVPIYIDLSYSIIDSGTYSMTLTAGYNISITRFSFSQIFFNIGEYDSTTSPFLYGLEWNITNVQASTNIKHFDSSIANQFIIGLKTFTCSTGQVKLEFDAQLGTYGTYGVKLIPPTDPEMTSAMVSMLYMMVWSCPIAYPYLNIDTSLCQDYCGIHTYLNSTDSTCRLCIDTLCLTCDNITDSSICLTCPDYFVTVGGDCICNTAGLTRVYSASATTPTCSLCGDYLTYCIQCSYTQNTSLPFNSSYFTCLDCNNTAGYFIDPNDLCSVCTIPNCITCSGIAQCSVCNPGYGITASGSCSTCPVTGCNTCLNLTYCSVCQSSYVNQSGACVTCPLSCSCGGYTLPRRSNGDCHTICGDGIVIFPYEECDDGNTISGDGCSSSCTIEAFSTCGGAPSECFLNSNINVALISTQVSRIECNTLISYWQVVPNLLIFSMYPTDWSRFITPLSPAFTLIAYSYNQGIITINYTYSETIQGKTIDFYVNPVGIVNSTYLSNVRPLTVSATIQPTNNLAAIYCSDGTCKLKDKIASYAAAQSTIAYIGLFLSLFSLKIVGLEMMGTLQLSYLILSDYDYVNPLLVGVLDRKEVNGISIDQDQSGSPSISSRMVLNGYTSQIFLHNYNVMFYLTLGLTLVGLILYNITYFINQVHQKQLKQNEDHEESSRSLQHEEPKQSKVLLIHRIAKYLLKEVLITFLVFSMFNLSFSAGLQMKYIDEVDAWSILAMMVSFTLIIAMVVAQWVTDKQEFGQYLDKFKPQRLQSRYITVTLIYRFVLGLLIALLNQWQQSGIIFLLVGFSFVAYIFHSEPFVDAIQNTRSKAIHCVHILILMVYHLYRCETVHDPVSSNYFLFPSYLQLAAVGLVVFGSTILLVYQVVLKIKQRFCSSESVSGEAEKQNIFSNLANHQNTVEIKQAETIEAEILDN